MVRRGEGARAPLPVNHLLRRGRGASQAPCPVAAGFLSEHPPRRFSAWGRRRSRLGEQGPGTFRGHNVRGPAGRSALRAQAVACGVGQESGAVARPRARGGGWDRSAHHRKLGGHRGQQWGQPPPLGVHPHLHRTGPCGRVTVFANEIASLIPCRMSSCRGRLSILLRTRAVPLPPVARPSLLPAFSRKKRCLLFFGVRGVLGLSHCPHSRPGPRCAGGAPGRRGRPDAAGAEAGRKRDRPLLPPLCDRPPRTVPSRGLSLHPRACTGARDTHRAHPLPLGNAGRRAGPPRRP